jgi:eukaryotic-like serine/threonine-protein kinase
LQGDKDESRKAYDVFFTIWKDADPDIPILKQAKAEYGKLQRASEIKSPEFSAVSME